MLHEILRAAFPSRSALHVWDVGAFRGDFAAKIIEAFPGSEGVLFEPAAESVRHLENRFREISGVTIHPVALSDSEDERSFRFHPDGPATSSLLPSAQPEEHEELRAVQVTTIDRVWEDAGRPKLHLLKVDAQGEDLRVLRGAEKAIAAHAPVLVVEGIFVPLYQEQADPIAILTFAVERGYRLARLLDVHLTSAGELAFADFVLTRAPARDEDCRPPFVFWDADDATQLRADLEAKEAVIQRLSAATDS
jgi:FkbM family methyltransferase